MPARFTVGLDVGTQGAKAVVFDLSTKKVVSRASRSYGLLPTSVQGRAEQDPATWISEGFAAVKEAVSKLEDAGSVVAVGVSGQQHGSVFLDSQGRVLRPAKLWCDTETAPQAERLSSEFGEAVVPAFTAPKITWLLDNEPDVAERVSCVCLPHDFVNMRLTGASRPVAEAGDASGTGYWDVENRRYDLKRAAAVYEASASPSPLSWLPELVDSPDRAIGTVSAEASEATGLPEGIPVSAGSGDNACAALGVGAVTPGQWVVSLGTSGTLFGPSSTPPPASSSSTVARFCDATGQWMPLLCTLNCTVPVEQVRKAWGLTHDVAASLAADVARRSGGVGRLSFLPYLAGERTPNWPWAKGCVLGIDPSTLESPEAAAGALYLAAVEGATFSLLSGLKEMSLDKKNDEPPPSSVVLVGGGARSPLWTRVVADSFGLPVTRPPEPEAAALGAALQAAAVAEGAAVRDFVASTAEEVKRAGADSSSPDLVTEPDLSKKAAYDEAFERHVALGEALFGAEGGVAKEMFSG